MNTRCCVQLGRRGHGKGWERNCPGFLHMQREGTNGSLSLRSEQTVQPGDHRNSILSLCHVRKFDRPSVSAPFNEMFPPNQIVTLSLAFSIQFPARRVAGYHYQATHRSIIVVAPKSGESRPNKEALFCV